MKSKSEKLDHIIFDYASDSFRNSGIETLEEWARTEPELGRWLLEFCCQALGSTKEIDQLYDELTDMIKTKNHIGLTK